MPCDTIQEVRLEIQNANIDLLKKAIENVTGSKVYQSQDVLSWDGGSYRNGTLRAYNENEAKQIKKAYSGEIVKYQAKKFGWQVKETKPFTYQLLKR